MMVKRHTKPSQTEPAGRHRREGGHDPHLERDADRSGLGQGHAREGQARRERRRAQRRQVGHRDRGSEVTSEPFRDLLSMVDGGNGRSERDGGRQEEEGRRRRPGASAEGQAAARRSGDRQEARRARREEGGQGGGGGGRRGAGVQGEKPGPARLRMLFEKELAPTLKKELGLTNSMQVPRLVKITINMGLGKATRTRRSSTPPSRSSRHHRPVSRSSPRRRRHRDLQAPQGPEDRRDGHAAPRAHVGVPRPPGQRSRCRASVTSRACRPRRSTAAATTPSASASRSSSPRSTTTRSTRSRA